MSALTFINSDMGGLRADTLRVAGSRIAAIGVRPEAADRVVDLQGDRLLPGLINAHDHLQLNSLPSMAASGYHKNVRTWIDDVNALRRVDPNFESGIAVSREERLLIGGVKNLLSGVTTVAQHDPLYPCLLNATYPTRVVTDYGWSHSLYLDGAEKVRNSHRDTPAVEPWIIHAAEGIDHEAHSEFERLEALGCIGANTLIVHGVALDGTQRLRLDRAAAGLIWCPASNLRLFGQTAQVCDLIAHGRVALGTDSRLSGSRDLLEELRIAGECSGLDEPILESLVTHVSARLLRLPDRGELKIGALADLLILPAGMRVSMATRADIRLVMLDGRVRYGDAVYAQLASPQPDWVEVSVDGRPKILDCAIAALLLSASVSEPGVELSKVWRAA